MPAIAPDAVTGAVLHGSDGEFVALEAALVSDAAVQLQRRAKQERVERRRMRFGKACERRMADMGRDPPAGSGESRHTLQWIPGRGFQPGRPRQTPSGKILQ